MSGLVIHLQTHRERCGLSRSELAERTGLSRQSIHSIEQGKYIPSTLVALQLAQALKCTVEDLFQLVSPEWPVALWASEKEAHSGAQVRVAKVGNRLVAHPLTGPERFLHTTDALVQEVKAGQVQLSPVTSPELWNHTLMLAGCDPAFALLQQTGPEQRIQTVHATSLEGLALLKAGQVHAAGIHLYDPESQTFNLPFLEKWGLQDCMVVSLWTWQQGLLVAIGNPLQIQSLKDLTRPEVRLVQRQSSAGSRILLDALLREAQLEQGQIRVSSTEAQSHLEVAQQVLSGQADVGLALQAVAEGAGLDFIPLVQERFDLVVAPQHQNHPVLQKLLLHLKSPVLRQSVQALGGYDPFQAGEVLQWATQGTSS